jgi:hypothetical protein
MLISLKVFIDMHSEQDNIFVQIMQNYMTQELYESMNADEELYWDDYSNWAQINESLLQHDPNKLKEYITNRFGKDIVSAKVEHDCVILTFKYDFMRKLYLKNEAFINTMHIFNYIAQKDADSEYVLVCEPAVSDEATDYIEDKCNGIMYHITKTEDSKNGILKAGLRCKTASYRDFPERGFVFATPDYKDYNKTKEQLKELLEELKFPNLDKCYVIKFDMRRMPHYIKFYKDTSMESEHAFYTYYNIPPKAIIGNYKLIDFLK